MNRPIILIVDDEEKNREQVKDYISEIHSECCFVEARNAAQALSILHRGLNPTLVILDYRMPMKTGIELNREIKSCYGYFPTILWTGDFDSEDVQAAVTKKEVDACLPKTASLKEFMAEVEKFL